MDKKVTNHKPLVSVIMPCYNHAEYVGEAIESVLNQTYDNIEFIVADNGSTDNSYEVIERYKDRITKIIRLGKNSPTQCALALQQSATGEYIAIMTSDDYWEPDKLELQMEAIAQHPGVKACFTHTMEMNETLQTKDEKNPIFKAWDNKNRYQSFKELLHINTLAYPSAVIEKDLYEKMGRGHNVRCFYQIGDWYLWMKILQEAEIYVVPKILVRYRWHKQGANRNASAVSRETLRRHWNEFGEMIQVLFDNMEDSFFKEVFREELVNPDATTHEELMCEKFMWLKKMSENNVLYETVALHFYYSHVYAKVAECMESKYGFATADFQKWSATVGSGIDRERELIVDVYKNAQVVQMKEMILERVRDEADWLQVKRQLFDMLPQETQNLIRKIKELCMELVGFIDESMRNENLYTTVVQLLSTMVEQLETVWAELEFAEFSLNKEELELYKELIGYASQEVIDLTEAIVPVTRYIEEHLKIYFEDNV